MEFKRGDIFFADLGPVIGSEQDGIRPVLIVQNDLGNKYSPTVIVVPITTKIKSKLPTHISIRKGLSGLKKDSILLIEQLRTLDKSRLKERIGKVDNKILEDVKEALKVSLNIRSQYNDIFKDW